LHLHSNVGGQVKTIVKQKMKNKSRRVKLKKDTGGDVDPFTKKRSKARRRCRQGSKSVNLACVKSIVITQEQIPEALQDDLSYARDYLMVLPQRIKEVLQAADDLLKEGKRR